jgi:NAD(P)-dependent dehydrogenase (short-subunit alcohol dehydrogenase family)
VRACPCTATWATGGVAALFEAAVAEFGQVDALLNVAGIGIGGPIHKTEMVTTTR